MRILVLIVILIGHFSCTNQRGSDNKRINSKVDTLLLAKYEAQFANSTGSEKELLEKLIPIIKKFSYRKLDTTIVQKCRLDTTYTIDTLTTRIYEESDSIYVKTELKRNGVKLWSKELTNPYAWINNSKLYQFDTRDKWVIFTIGVYYAVPDIDKISKYQNLSEMAVDFGVRELTAGGIAINKDDYRNYIINYKGDLVTFGEPENRDGIFIWYAPVKKFILYYHE